MTNLDFPRIAREQFGIERLEFVNQLWEAPTSDYVRRLASADNHLKWVDISAELGGHAIRTNMYPGEKQPATPAETDGFISRGISASSSRATACRRNRTRVSAGCRISAIFPKMPRGGEVDAIREGRAGEVLRFRRARQGNDDGHGPDDEDRRCRRLPRLLGIEYEGSRMPEFEGIQAAKRYLDKWTACGNLENMRNLLLACLFVALPVLATDAEDVKAAEMNWFNGITKNNFPLLEKVLADDLHYLHSTGVIDTKASYIKSMSSGKQKYSTGKINDLKIRVYGTAAVINGDANFEFVTDGKPGKGHLKYTHVFAKGPKGWQLVSHQSLKIAD